jgi:hypothetical protein
VKQKGDELYRAIKLHIYRYIYIYINPHDTHQIIARYHRKRTLVGFSKM